MSERFYINCPLNPGPIQMSGAEAHHLATVCRLRPDDVVCLFNGDGKEYPARVTAVQPRQVSLEVLTPEARLRELPFTVVVAAPLPRGDRSHFLVEKLTEIGVTAFVPLITCRSVVKASEARQDKLKRYVIEASKQCGRNVLMRIESPVKWQEYSPRKDLAGVKLLADPGGTPIQQLSDVLTNSINTTLAVGPEGGFSDEEITDALAAGWQAVGLGPRILRVETAALVMAAAVTLLRCGSSKH